MLASAVKTIRLFVKRLSRLFPTIVITVSDSNNEPSVEPLRNFIYQKGCPPWAGCRRGARCKDSQHVGLKFSQYITLWAYHYLSLRKIEFPRPSIHCGPGRPLIIQVNLDSALGANQASPPPPVSQNELLNKNPPCSPLPYSPRLHHNLRLLLLALLGQLDMEDRNDGEVPPASASTSRSQVLR